MADSGKNWRNRFLFSWVAFAGLSGVMLAGSGRAFAGQGEITLGAVGSIESFRGADAVRLQPPDDDVIQRASDAIREYPDDGRLYAIRAQAYMLLNPPKLAEATADVEKAIALEPNNPEFVNLRLQLASAKYRSKDYKGAIDEATKVLAMRGQAKNKVALTIRAAAYCDMAAANPNDIASMTNAIKDYDVLISLDPADATSLRNRGVAFYKMKQFDQAIADFDGYIKAKPNEADGYNFKALAYMMMNPPQYDKAVEAYTTFLARKPGDTIALYNRGLAYYQTKVYEKALSDFLLASMDAKHPNARDIPGYVADCLIKLGRTPEAEKAFTVILGDRHTKDGEAYLSRGTIRLGFAAEMKEDDPNRKVKLQAALADFNQAVQLMPNAIEPLLNRSLTYFKLGRWTESIADATAALKIKPDNPDALITRADAAYNAANAGKDKAAYAAAIADYKTYLMLPGLKPEQVKSAAEGLALAAGANGDYALAVAVCNDLLARDPTMNSAVLMRGLAHYNAKQYDRAITDFDAYIAKEPGEAYGYLYRGLALKATNNHEKAAADFDRSYGIKPDFAAANNAGEEYLRVGNAVSGEDPFKAYAEFEKAIGMFDKALTLKPDAAKTHYNKGVALSQQGRLQEMRTPPVKPLSLYRAAVAAYEKYLELTPNATDVAEVRKIIEGLKQKAGL